MVDFKESISLDKIRLIIDEYGTDFGEIIEPYVLQLYIRVLEYGIYKGYGSELFEVQNSHYGDSLVLGASHYENEILKLERKHIRNLRMGDDFTLDNQNDQFAILNYLISELKKELNHELRKYAKEEIFIVIYMLSSMMSFISVTCTQMNLSLDNIEEKNKIYPGVSNFFIDSLNVIFKSESIWSQHLLGSQKKCCEYLINYILNINIDYSTTNNSDFDIERLFILSESIIENVIKAKSLNSLNKMSHKMKVSDGILLMSKELEEKLSNFNTNYTDNTLDLFSNNANELISEFEDIKGYSPQYVSDYVLDFANKHLIVEASLNIVEDRFLYVDMIQSTGYGYDSIYNVLSSLSLKTSSNVEDSIFSNNNRLYRTPIIKLDNYYILSNDLLFESAQYLRHRVLRKEFTTNKRFEEKLIEFYDEFELKELENLIESNNITGGINLKIDKCKELQPLLVKGISKEIDFYFVLDNVMYAMEFKNQKIDNNLYDMCKSYSKNVKNKDRHLRLIHVLRNNLDVLNEYLNVNVSAIKSFLVFKKKSSFSDFYDGDDIFVCSYSEFYKFCEDLLKINEL